MSLCTETGILDECHCHDANALGLLVDRYNNTPYCAWMKDWEKENVNTMLERMHCAGEVSYCKIL